jgi:alpha-tubulin suppressor-like RCC1 family protein
MSTVNKTAILAKLQQTLDEVYSFSSSEIDDVLALALSTRVYTETNIIVVPDVERLPVLTYYDSPSGMIYYIDSIDVFAISAGTKWKTLDGRLLRQDTVYSDIAAWGFNSGGQLGDNTTINRSSPVAIIGGFSDWCQVTSGTAHSLGVRTNGTLWAWGSRTSGQLGDNTVGALSSGSSSPVSVVGGFTDWCQVSAGFIHSLGLRSNGTLWSWGANGGGRLGTNNTINRSSPVSVVGGFTDWCQVSAGTNASNLAVRCNGTAWSWGCNQYGILGDDSITNKSSPVSVVGGFADWCQVSAGTFHSLGVRTNGTAWGWGFGGSGRLGTNETINRSSPVSVVGGFADWCQVSAGGNHSLGLRTNGTVWAWGNNNQGRLGDNTTTFRSSPVSVVGGFTDWCQISSGSYSSLALRSNGTIWSWGCNIDGQLGDGTISARSSPVSVLGGFTDWCQIASGRYHSFAIRLVC